MSGNIFDEFSKENTDHTRAAQQHDKDMREAIRMIMTRREGRLFMRKTLETTNDINHLRGVALMVMDYMEAIHV